MSNSNFNFSGNKGQVNLNTSSGTIQATQNVLQNRDITKEEELIQLLQKLVEVVESEEQVDEEVKEVLIPVLQSTVQKVQDGTAKPSTFKALNKTLVELSGYTAASAALGQVVSAVMDVVSTWN